MAATFRPGGTKFTFTSIPPSGEGVIVNFRAHLTNISDSYNGQWNEHMDMGRGDPKFMYSQYSRTISLSFMCVALEPSENTFWLEAINQLTQMTKPDYRAGLGFNGVFCDLVIGEYIKERGFLNSVSVSVDNETPWISDVPIVLSVDVDFRVVGNSKPSYSAGGQGGLGTKGYGIGKTR